MLRNLIEKAKMFHQDENGDIVQTAIIIGVLALVGIAALTILRQPILNAFRNIRDAINDAGTKQTGP